MRRPTPIVEIYAWHTSAITGGEIEIHSEPQCGWFKRRLVKHGPWVPARIWLDQEIDMDTGELLADERLLCEVLHVRSDAAEQWAWLCDNPISKAEYDYLVAAFAWSAQHAPHEPRANPKQPVNWLYVPVPTFTQEKTQ